MKLGDKCYFARGWPIVAYGPKCDIHGCETVICVKPGPTYQRKKKARKVSILCPPEYRDKRHRMLCIECYREKSRKSCRSYNKRVRDHHKPHYITNNTLEGSPGCQEFEILWTAKNDRMVDKFWASRGMTEEDAQIKFGVGTTVWYAMKRQEKRAKAA